MTSSKLPGPPPELPALVVHADWGREAKKRWMAKAILKGRRYHLSAPELVGDCATFFARLRNGLRREGSVFVGFDFLIGVPAAFAAKAGVSDFLTALPQFGEGQWNLFFDVAKTKPEISLHRPFYPNAPGGKRLAHLLDRLQLESKDDLLRQCERRTKTRTAACPLFWTLGAKQVGKAAIAGWKDLLVPRIRANNETIAFWPFSGELNRLFRSHPVVVAETYPAEAYQHLGFSRTRWSKRSQSGRHARGKEIRKWALQRPVALDQPTLTKIDGGFGTKKDGEDPFDALVGLCSMLEVVLGYRADGAPNEERIRKVEGWILGQAA